MKIKSGDLFWDYPESIDRRNSTVIQTGNLESLKNSQRTICNLMQKVRLKGVGRPKKKRVVKNLFDLCIS